jgi:hypothetical protein
MEIGKYELVSLGKIDCTDTRTGRLGAFKDGVDKL